MALEGEGKRLHAQHGLHERHDGPHAVLGFREHDRSLRVEDLSCWIEWVQNNKRDNKKQVARDGRTTENLSEQVKTYIRTGTETTRYKHDGTPPLSKLTRKEAGISTESAIDKITPLRCLHEPRQR